MASTRSRLDEIVASFATLEDPRSEINRRHPLPSVLVIAVLAVLAGAAGPTAIARWARFKEDLLAGALDLPNGIPGKDVFRRVLMVLKPDAFEACFNAWIIRAVSISPSQYATSASVFTATHWNTAGASAGDSWPAITRGVGRMPTTAVFAMFIWLPCVVLTLTRTSCRAFPRGETQTVIGKPVVSG